MTPEGATNDDGARASRQMRSARHGLSRYLVVLGLLNCVVVVGSEAVFRSDPARQVFTTTLTIAWVALYWWAFSRGVLSRSTRPMWVALLVWVVAFVFVVIPFVQRRVGESPAWWSLVAVVMAAPFFVTAFVVDRSEATSPN